MIEFILLCLCAVAIPRKKPRQRMIYCIIMCAFMCCLVGLRNANIGQGDTAIGYIPEFKRIISMSYGDVITTFTKDSFYYIVVKFFQNFSTNEYIYLFVFGIPYNVTISYFIYKYSPYPGLSYLGVMGLSIWKIAFTGMRHVTAASFLILSLVALINNNKKMHWIFIGIASLFHSSALVFFVVYPISKISNLKKFWPLTCVIALISAFTRESILLFMTWMFDFFKMSRYEKYSEWLRAGNGQGFLLNLTIALFLWYFYGRLTEADENMPSIENHYQIINGQISYILLDQLQMITLIITSLAIAVNEFARLSNFFGIITIVFIPQYIQLEKNNKTRLILRITIGLFFIILFLFIVAPRSNLIPFYFNWEEYTI